MDDLYQEEILEHYKNPHHFGKLNPADQVIEETNASCGDTFTFYLVFNPESSVIKDIKFEGVGCAISTAASSMLVEHLIGRPVSEIDNLTPDFMQDLIGGTITPTRLKCLMLPAKALRKINL